MCGLVIVLSVLNSVDDEIDGDWLGYDGVVVFSRGYGSIV